jgi:fucose 4-O-acetylase-like acetyltransferase
MDQFTSQKFRFYAFISMVLLVFVHGYNLNDRFLLAFSVVHEPLTLNAFTQYFLANGMLRFRIPMLFIISGYLFALRDDKPYEERVQKRLRTLLLPYVLWSAIGLALTFLLEHWAFTREAVAQSGLQAFGEKRVDEYSPGQLLIRLVMAPVPFQLWFIRVLLIYNLAYPWLKVAVIRAPLVFFPIAILIWFGNANLFFLEGEGLLFFSLGIWLCKSGYNIQVPPSWLQVTPVVSAWVLVAALKTWMAFQSQLEPPVLIPTLLFMHKFVVASGLIAVWFGADAIVRFFMNRRWFVWLSAFSFIIYAFHVPLINYALTFIFPYVQHIQHFRILTFFLLPVAVIGICVTVGFLLRATLPKFYSLLTGGRGLA